MISNCGSDERGKYSGGKAGDQTGNEWVIRTWYNRPWTHVLRHPDEAVRKRIAYNAKAAALNDLVGYDQDDRYTYWDHLKASNYDPAQITIKCEADCSSGVSANVKAAGYVLNIKKLKDVSIYMYTGNERAVLQAAGFEVLTDPKYLNSDDYLLEGDILLCEGHHTATNLTDGEKAIVKYDYELLGWNKDDNGWWYATGHNKGQFHQNNAVRIYNEKTGVNELFFFDTEGYCVVPTKIECDERGAMKYIYGDRIQ